MKVRNTSTDTRTAAWYRDGGVEIAPGEVVDVDDRWLDQVAFHEGGVFVPTEAKHKAPPFIPPDPKSEPAAAATTEEK